LKTPIGGPFSPGHDEHLHRLGPMQTVDFPMRRYSENQEVDYLIVGVGAAGGVLLQRLARAGFEVVGMEAGPFWDTERDWVSDEVGSHQLYWEDLRITGGKNPLALGFGRSHDIANLFVCDGSILPTQGSANPGLTIQALAARTADYLISQGTAIFDSDRRDMTAPPVRMELSPPGTRGSGVPRLR
jgi:choline dehydrogenase-like flavoprotein